MKVKGLKDLPKTEKMFFKNYDNLEPKTKKTNEYFIERNTRVHKESYLWLLNHGHFENLNKIFNNAFIYIPKGEMIEKQKQDYITNVENFNFPIEHSSERLRLYNADLYRNISKKENEFLLCAEPCVNKLNSNEREMKKCYADCYVKYIDQSNSLVKSYLRSLRAVKTIF